MTTPIIGEGDKIITTVLLNGERIHVRVHAHANGQNVFDAIIRHIGLNEVIYFGLMIIKGYNTATSNYSINWMAYLNSFSIETLIKDGEQQFLNLEDKLNKLAKYAPHLWKDDGSCNSSLVFTLFFRVKYYVENICLLQEQATRHQYYLQLRKDVLENSVRLHDDTSMVLASYALQAELGDYDKNVHGFDYFVPQHYLPAKTIAKLTIPYIKNALPAMHQSHRSLTEGQSEIEFLKEAQKLSEYGVLFHRVYKKEYNKKVPYNLGICVRGLVVYEETGPVRNPVCKHPWSKIKKMSFKRSKFIVEADSTSPHYAKMTLYTTNYKRSRYLLKMSSSFFNFQMMMASRLAMLPDYLPPEEAMHPHHPSSQSHQAMIPSVRIDPAQNIMQDMVNGEDSSMSHQIQNQRTSNANTPHHPSVKETPKPKPKPKPEVKQYTLDLLKRDGSFGFSIVGGIELGGIFVKDVTPGGPAAISGLINAGDRIVQINKDSFENVTRREAIATLRNAPDKSRFIMETFGQNLVIEADTSIVTPLAMSAQSLSIMQPQVPVPQTDRESEYIRVDLPKKDNSFGIGFTGGPELGGVYIKSLLPGGSAETDGRIAIGDRLVEIDQTNVEGLTRKQIQELLKQSQGLAAIIIERYKQIPAAGGLMYIDREKVLKSSQNFTSITLNKKNDSLGFSITGGLDLGGIFVKYLNPNGPASMDGRLEVGDRVVAVNDISLETATRQKALEIIRNATSPVNLIIEKCISPGGGNPMDGSMQPGQVNGQQMTRSDSIKSLPTTNRRPRQAGLSSQSRNITYSMQHLPNANANVAHDVSYKEHRPQQQRPPSLMTSSSQQKKSVQDVFVVDLNKHNGSYGISLTGGHEVGGIYIKAVMPGGAADADGRIMKGDKVIEINARRMDGLSRQEAVEWLKSSGVMATFVLERFTQIQPHMNHQTTNQTSSQFSSFDGEFVHVELVRKNNTFGLSLLGGPELRGVFIKNLLPGGAASKDSRIAKGDRVVEINAVSLDGLNRYQANDLLKQSGATVNLLIEKIQNLTDVPALDADLYSVELKKSESGFGFSITGGPELGGVYIKGILPGGAADSSHKMLRGDRLVEVNGVSLDGVTKQQAVDVIRKSPPVSSLLLERHGGYDNMILPESEYFTVELHKKYNGYGLSLTGGPEIDGVYVKQVQRDSAAYQDGRIKKGDRLITINGRNVESCTKQKCTEMLKQSADIAVVHFERCVIGDDLPPLDTVLTVVELTKGANGFGISLTGGPETGGIFVKALMPGGAAESDGRIFVGDRVVEMNSVSLEGYTRQQATDLLKTSTSKATFVLERYKQSAKSVASTRKLHMIHNPLSNDSSRPTSPTFKEQHNSFPPLPLYNGAAPSVPPRHLNNGIPSRESAFKRLEQQQLKMAQQNNVSIGERPPMQNTIPNTYYQSGHHNIQGSPVSSRIPAFMQRQNSTDQNNLQPSNPGAQNSFKTADNATERPPQLEQMNVEIGSLSLVDGPIRKFVDNTTIEDSPQRFLQQFSRSVVSSQSNNNTTPSRIAPLGPVSSVIFGNNRDNRNVHEILDPGEKTLEETLIAMNETQRLEYLRINHPELLNEYRNASILSSTSNGNVQATNALRDDLSNQRPLYNPRETVVCLSNGKPLTQTFNQQTPVDITTRPVVDPNAKFHQDQRHLINSTSSTNGQLGSLNHQPSGVATTTQGIDRHTGLVKVLPDSFTAELKNRTSILHENDQMKRQKAGGLQWVSLNESGEGNWSNNTAAAKSLKKQDVVMTTTPSHDRNRRQTSPQKQLPVSSSGKTNPTSSTGIPVPLASKFHPVSTESKVKRTAFAGGDYVFEVNLSKGSLGLGMNLAGGGSDDSPVTIKKIAPGTAADECGQLRVGDVILEINGKPVSHLLAKDVIGMLRSCPSDVLLSVKRKTYETHYHVTSGTSSSYIGL